MPTRVLIPAGALGLGFDEAALWRGVKTQPDIICIDGGSTDSGPHYLGTGTSKYTEAATKAEWRLLMQARAAAGVPLVVGTAGTCGTDSTVDWMYRITCDLARELGQNLTIARLYSNQSSTALKTAYAAGKIAPLWPEQPLDTDVFDSCTNTVALAGAEQIDMALQTGADIVIAGRTTDTATIAALPLRRGDHAGAAWHGAKIGECGALCSTNPVSGVIVIDFDTQGFTVRPMAEGARCTPQLVAAHMLYENSDPNILHEPGGYLDVGNARYRQADETSVTVTGAEWHPAPYTVKLEGARLAGYQSCTLVLLRDPHYVNNAATWCAHIESRLRDEIRDRMGLSPDEYALEFRRIGQNATLGDHETAKSSASEVGVLMVATAADQTIAREMAKLANPYLLHFPLRADEPQVTFAFPFSPAEWDRGAVYEFCLHHVLELEDPMQVFDLRVDEVAHG